MNIFLVNYQWRRGAFHSPDGELSNDHFHSFPRTTLLSLSFSLPVSLELRYKYISPATFSFLFSMKIHRHAWPRNPARFFSRFYGSRLKRVRLPLSLSLFQRSFPLSIRATARLLSTEIFRQRFALFFTIGEEENPTRLPRARVPRGIIISSSTASPLLSTMHGSLVDAARKPRQAVLCSKYTQPLYEN